MKGFRTTVLAMALLVAASTVSAADLTLRNVDLGGFVTGRYLSDNNARSTFQLSEVELDVGVKGEKVGAQVDIDSTGSVLGLGVGDANLEIEQGYVEVYNLFQNKGLDFRFGKFKAPIGYESLDPVDLYPITHSLLFTFAIPTNVTGALIHKTFSDNYDLKLYAVNGWDQNTDFNRGKTLGGRFGGEAGKLGWGISGIWGPEKALNNAQKRFVLDADFSYNGFSDWTLGGELNVGREKGGRNISGTGVLHREWRGFMGFARKQLTDKLGVSGRLDWFQTTNASTKNWGLTLAADRQETKNLVWKVEATYQQTDDPLAKAGAGLFVPRNKYLQLAYEMNYKF